MNEFALEIRPEDLIEDPVCIGHIKNVKVYKVKLKGGGHIIAKSNGKDLDPLAFAPHPAIAKFMAMQKNPDLTWTELSKSEDEMPVEYFKHLIPVYENELERWKALAKK